MLMRLKKRWLTPRIEFGYLDCVDCKQRIAAPHCPIVNTEIVESEKIEDDVKKKAFERGKFEGLDKDERLKKPGDPFFNDL